MKCGTIQIESDYATPGYNPGKIMRLVVNMFLIKHPKGLVLVDTGNHPDVAINAAAYWGKSIAKWLNPEMKPEDAADKQIERLGFSVSDVKYVILTHMHIDHAGGMCLFPEATFLIQKDELLAAMWPGYNSYFDRGHYEIKDFIESRRFKVIKLDGDYDIFGDDKIKLLKTGGHSAGHQMVLLKLGKNKYCLLPGDAAFMPEQLEYLCLPGNPIPEPEIALEFVRRIKQMQSKNKGIQILFSHPKVEN